MTIKPGELNKELKSALVLRYGVMADAALVLDIDTTKLSKILRNRRTPHLEEIKKFERVLGKGTVQRCFPGI